MEATCQVAVEVRDYYGVRITPDEPCGAPIPRLRGDCQNCGHWDHSTFTTGACGYATRLQRDHGIDCGCTNYLGPLASKCTRGHPVAVPTEAD